MRWVIRIWPGSASGMDPHLAPNAAMPSMDPRMARHGQPRSGSHAIRGWSMPSADGMDPRLAPNRRHPQQPTNCRAVRVAPPLKLPTFPVPPDRKKKEGKERKERKKGEKEKRKAKGQRTKNKGQRIGGGGGAFSGPARSALFFFLLALTSLGP